NGYYWRVNARDNNCASSNGFNVWYFSTIDQPTPAELIHFSAKPHKDYIALSWQTASEVGFSGFELQRSTQADAGSFHKIAWYDSQADNNNSNDVLGYTHIDNEVQKGQTYYYRLRQVDLDGSVEYSSIVSARIDAQGNSLEVFPNPASESIKVFLHHKNSRQDITLKVYDTKGSEVIILILDANALSNGYSLIIHDLPKGTYFLHLENDDLKESIRFVKK
ncbi:MAG TPA: T9SS type A sorting domain-containing protein, partial [Phaeodactylibacter sp.]|nr:T9SS type A sorting domain-containing protein [Phaeodactylibacter sp.]